MKDQKHWSEKARSRIRWYHISMVLFPILYVLSHLVQ